MKRLFLLSMAFVGCVVFIPVALGPLRDELYILVYSSLYTNTTFGRMDRITVIILTPFVIIAGAGAITLGAMIVKRIIGLIKK